MKKKASIKHKKRIRKKREKTRLLILSLFLIFFLVMLSYTTYIILTWHKDNKEIENIEKKIDSEVEIIEVDEQGSQINPPNDKKSDYWYYIDMPFYDVNFNELLKKNSDTVAFIHIPNTNINYPVVQTADNDYYLSHAFDKSKNSAGWVYMDYRNNKNFEDDNTIIYGHGRINNTVFGSLKDTITEKWQGNKDNYIIQISTPTTNFVYQIFSIYTIESEIYYITPKFSTTSDKDEWLTTMKNRNKSLSNAEVNTNDKIITLSTCLNNSGGRIVVQGKLIKSIEKK